MHLFLLKVVTRSLLFVFASYLSSRLLSAALLITTINRVVEYFLQAAQCCTANYQYVTNSNVCEKHKSTGVLVQLLFVVNMRKLWKNVEALEQSTHAQDITVGELVRTWSKYFCCQFDKKSIKKLRYTRKYCTKGNLVFFWPLT